MAPWFFGALVVAALLGSGACRERSPDAPELLFRSASDHLRRGQLETALTEAERGSKFPDPTWRQRFQLLRCELSLYQRKLDTAEAILRGPDVAVPADPGVLAQKRMLEGYLLSLQRRYEDAEAALTDAAELARKSGNAGAELESHMIGGNVQLHFGRLAEAERNYEAALRIASAAGDTYQQSAALMNMGLTRIRRYRNDEALAYLQRSLILARQSGAALLAAAVESNIALCQGRLGNYAEAIQAKLNVLDIQRQEHIREHELTTLGELGSMYLDLGNTGEARKWYERARALAAEMNAAPEEAAYTARLATALAEANQVADAQRLAYEAAKRASALKDPSDLAAVDFARARVAEAAGERDTAASLYRKVIAGTKLRPMLVWNAQAGLARLYGSRGGRGYYEQALRSIERARSELNRTDYKIAFLTALIRFYQDYVEELIRAGDDAGALRVIESSRAQLLAARTRAEIRTANFGSMSEWSRIASRVNGVILSYWVTPARSYAWVLTPRTMKRVELPGQETLARLVESYRQFIERDIRDPLPVPSSPGRQLYRMLVEPVERFIPRGTQVFIVPDGPLSNLNFEALISDRPHPHYWIEDVTVALAPSVSSLGIADTPTGGDRGALLIGDPVLNTAEYAKLPFAGAELAGITRRLGKRCVVRTGAQATPESFMAARPEQFGIIHFATHAVANRESPLDSAIILSPANGNYKLYTRDIAAMHLTASLVSISACRGAGASAYSGEGLVGFAWAFLRAGARNVIAGLWDVSDRSTAELMDSVYEGVARGESPAAALRNAKLRLMRSGPNFGKPYYWAPFELYTQASSARTLYAFQKMYSH